MPRKSIIKTAQQLEGIKENPAGSNIQIFGEWYGMNGVKWCAIFVSYVYHKAGVPLGKIETKKGYHYCQGAYNFWKASGELTKFPQQGDIVLYDWKGDGHCDHTGIFDQWKDDSKTRFFAWEGNTEHGNDSDGGKVMRRERAASLVKAFVSPKILNGNSSIPFDDTLKIGSSGADVSYIQKLLWDLKYKIVVDGLFGPNTEEVVKKFQKKHFLDENGLVTPALAGALEEVRALQKQKEKKTSTASYLQKGNSGSAVVVLQKALKRASNNSVLIADGVFGNLTQKALKAYQQSHSLVADGIAGPKTFASLGIRL